MVGSGRTKRQRPSLAKLDIQDQAVVRDVTVPVPAPRSGATSGPDSSFFVGGNPPCRVLSTATASPETNVSPLKRTADGLFPRQRETSNTRFIPQRFCDLSAISGGIGRTTPRVPLMGPAPIPSIYTLFPPNREDFTPAQHNSQIPKRPLQPVEFYRFSRLHPPQISRTSVQRPQTQVTPPPATDFPKPSKQPHKIPKTLLGMAYLIMGIVFRKNSHCSLSLPKPHPKKGRAFAA